MAAAAFRTAVWEDEATTYPSDPVRAADASSTMRLPSVNPTGG